MRSISEAAFHILLSLVDANRHGLGIADQVSAETNGTVALGPGVLYTTLHKLAEAGLITETADRPAAIEDDPRRRYYKITAAGRRSLRAETGKWARTVEAARSKGLLDSSGVS